MASRQLRRALGDAPLELGVELLELARLAIQLGEDPDLGAQELRHDRHRHVVDRARLVAAQPVEIGQLDRRDEDDRGRLEARMLADHRRQLEAVELRHADIDQHDRDLVLQQLLQRLARRVALIRFSPSSLEDHLVAQQLGRLVVDQQDVDLVVRRPCIAVLSDAATCAAPTAAARC